MSVDDLEKRLKQVLVKAETGRPATPEDVHLAAQMWLVDGQPDEAAAGHTTGADVRFAGVVRANLGGGDAAAQTVCDAAHVWRARTRLDRGPEPGPSRRILAAVVDQHQPSWWRRNRLRVVAALGFTASFCLVVEGVMAFEGWGPGWVRLALLMLALVCVLAFPAVLAHVHRSSRR